MRTILDDLDDLITLGVGYPSRLKRIKKSLQYDVSLWSSDILYVKHLARYYLPETADYGPSSFKEERKIPVKYFSEKERLSGTRGQRLIPFVTFGILGLFLLFVVFPTDDLPSPGIENESNINNDIFDDVPNSSLQSLPPDSVNPSSLTVVLSNRTN